LAHVGEEATVPAEVVVRYDGFGNRITAASDDLAPCDGSTNVSLSWCDTLLCAISRNDRQFQCLNG